MVSQTWAVAVAFAFLLLAGILTAYVAGGWRAGIYRGRGGRVERRASPRVFAFVAIMAGMAAAGTVGVAVVLLLAALRGD